MTFLLWSFDLGLSNLLWLADMDAYGLQFTHKQLIFFWGVGWLAGLVEISYFFCCGVWFGFVRFVMTHRYGRLWRTICLPFWYWRLFVSKISTYFNMTSINISWLTGLAAINHFFVFDFWFGFVKIGNIVLVNPFDSNPRMNLSEKIAIKTFLLEVSTFIW